MHSASNLNFKINLYHLHFPISNISNQLNKNVKFLSPFYFRPVQLLRPCLKIKEKVQKRLRASCHTAKMQKRKMKILAGETRTKTEM